MTKVRTRFAPSPTGYMHVGGVRTALFAWLVAKQAGGTFILRIEDTDKQREVAGSEDHISKTLRALGLDYDEGPDIGGDYGPYRQSERLDIYKDWANKLIKLGRAYVDPYSVEEVEAFRQQAKSDKKPFLYRNHRPKTNLSWDGSKPLRFLSKPQDYHWHDEIMGDLSAGEEAIDDFILIKGDGYPTYNFAHIVDDHLMEISHVFRSHEFLASVPRFLNLYEAFDFKKPLLATVPPVLAPGGKRKLSKRDGAKDVLEYIDQGYLPETLLNFMASLGWNDGTTQEIYSVEELIKKFSVSHIQKSGASFDEQRLLWMNGSHIRNLSSDEFMARTKSYLPKSAANCDRPYIVKVLDLIKDRLKYLAEIPELTSFFFEETKVNPKLIANDRHLKSIDKTELKALLTKTLDVLKSSDFTLDDVTNKLNGLLKDMNQKPAVLFSLIRIATTQSPFSPGLFDTLVVLGKDRTLKRIAQQIKAI